MHPEDSLRLAILKVKNRKLREKLRAICSQQKVTNRKLRANRSQQKVKNRKLRENRKLRAIRNLRKIAR